MASSIHTEHGVHPAPPQAQRRAFRRRLRGAVLAAICGGLLATAWQLAPRRVGHGTHEQLGLPTCSFLAETGWPCPSCGLTTSVSAAAHGRFGLAFEAQPFGIVLFAALVGGLAVGAVELAAGRDVLRRLRPSWWWLAGAMGGMLAGWGIKVAVGVAAGELPTH